MLRNVQSRVKSGTLPMTTSDTLDDYGLGGVDCPKCRNTGTLLRTDENGNTYARECECMAKRRSMRRIRNSGMSDMLTRYTFDAYETPDDVRRRIKRTAMRFADEDNGWFYLAGQSGSGKTHICTAICSRLIERGKEVYYMRWRDESRQIKAMINTEEVEKPLDKLKRVDVLYIDDFFKGGSNEADVRLAFEILNARYNDSKLRTVISSELGIEDILDIDEAICGRIKERSRGFLLRAPGENWRFRSAYEQAKN